MGSGGSGGFWWLWWVLLVLMGSGGFWWFWLVLVGYNGFWGVLVVLVGSGGSGTRTPPEHTRTAPELTRTPPGGGAVFFAPPGAKNTEFGSQNTGPGKETNQFTQRINPFPRSPKWPSSRQSEKSSFSERKLIQITEGKNPFPRSPTGGQPPQRKIECLRKEINEVT